MKQIWSETTICLRVILEDWAVTGWLGKLVRLFEDGACILIRNEFWNRMYSVLSDQSVFEITYEIYQTFGLTWFWSLTDFRTISGKTKSRFLQLHLLWLWEIEITIVIRCQTIFLTDFQTSQTKATLDWPFSNTASVFWYERRTDWLTFLQQFRLNWDVQYLIAA